MPESIRFLNLRESFSGKWFEEWTELYERTFTDEDTRESSEPWPEWYATQEVVWEEATGKAKVPLTTILAISRKEGETEKLLGGINIEFYSRSGCALVTYLAVDPSNRRGGLSRRLLDEACEYVKELAATLESPLSSVFFETYRLHALASESVEDQEARLTALHRLGGMRILFEEPGYTQPALGEGQHSSSKLYLCYFQSYSNNEEIELSVLNAFLREFAYALTGDEEVASQMGVPLVGCENGERKIAEAADLPSLESNHLNIQSFAVSLHLLEENREKSSRWQHALAERPAMAEESCDVFRTWEHDLMAHAYVDRRPFTSRCFELLDIASLEIEFPKSLSYSSEGRVMELHTRSGKPERRLFRLSVSRTRFRESGRAVWHLTLRSISGHSLSEFDFIKIISLYAGYESTESSLQSCVFRLLDRQGRSIKGDCIGFDNLVAVLFEELAEARQRIDGIVTPLIPRPSGGTVQILTEGGKLKANLQTVVKLAREARPGLENASDKSELEESFARSSELRAALLTTCGIVQGIFDFNEIDSSELADILDPTMPELEAFYRIHRSTFTCISPDDRAFEACENDIGISPYLILPHAVLLHEGATLRFGSNALDAGFEALASLNTANRKGRTKALQMARQRWIEASRCLDSLPAPNPFNYFTEREFLERATENHGLPARLATERSRASQLSRLIESIDDRSRRGKEWALGVMLTVLTVISAGEFIDQAAHAVLDWGRDGFVWGWDTGLTLIVSASLCVCSALALALMLRSRPSSDDADK